MRLLVFGGDGQVGREFRRLDGSDGHAVVALSSKEADITRPGDVAAAIRQTSPDIVVNAAAYTAVDRAESDPETAFAVNRDGARHIAAACAERSLPMVHISTDYVFDGAKRGAYREDDPVQPQSVYGASKEAGEQAVRESAGRHAILRTSWVFSPHGQNFVKTMLRLADERDEIGIIDDQFGCPTSAGDLARAILGIVSRLGESRGTDFHFCGAGQTSWHGFAREIFEQRRRITGQAPPKLRAIPTAEYPTPATRPANSELDCTRFAAAFGFAPRPWQAGLAEVLDELLAA
jgi:dTDP-4-dehydrorhamnose reductase